MRFFNTLSLAFGLLQAIVSGSPVPVSVAPEYFHSAPVTRAEISVSQIQNELGSQLSKGSLIIGPEDPLFKNVTLRFSVFTTPKDIRVVVQVKAESDVSKAVKYCNKNSIDFLAVNRGHGFTETIATIQGGMQINIAQLTELKLARDKKTARLQGGLANREVIGQLWDQGLVTATGGNTCVGVLGPALGGGFGRLQGKYGLISDNINSLKVVLADGKEITVSQGSYPDLYWAMKGAGHQFGIVTSIEMKVYPSETKTWHYHNYWWTQDQLERIFETLNKVQGKGKLPERMAVNYGTVVLDPTYSATEAIIFWTFAYYGSAAEAEKILEPFNKIPKRSDVKGDVSYPELLEVQGTGDVLQGVQGGGCQALPFVGSTAHLQDYNVTAQRQIYNHFNMMAAKEPELAQYARVFYEGYSTLGTQRIPSALSAYPHRDEYLLTLFSAVVPEGKREAGYKWAKEVKDMWNAGQPHRKPTTYVNYATGGPNGDSLEEMYGHEPWRLARLRSLKAKYDPTNRFRFYNPIIPGKQ